MKAVFQLVVMALLYSVSSGQISSEDSDFNIPVKACGPKLDEKITEVCRGRRYCGYVKKSLQDTEMETDSELQLQEEQDDANLPILAKTLAQTLFPTAFRRQNRVVRGIVSECCRKACTVGVVKQYCSC